MGNFSIQYNFQAIAVSLMVMSVKQCTSTEAECMEGKQAHWVAGAATATVFAGAMLGQLTVSSRLSSLHILKNVGFIVWECIAPHRWAT